MTIRGWRALALLLLFVVVLGAILAALIASTGPHALGHAVMRIDADDVSLPRVHVHALAAVLAGIVGALVALLVVPLAVCVPLLAIVFVLACALLATAGTAAVVLSPLLLLGWVGWRLARPARTAT